MALSDKHVPHLWSSNWLVVHSNVQAIPRVPLLIWYHNGMASFTSEAIRFHYNFWILQGGVWGMASATALENLPTELRGLASGILQQGYAVGYLIAAVVNLVGENRLNFPSIMLTPRFALDRCS
jgi:hypothetical protein